MRPWLPTLLTLLLALSFTGCTTDPDDDDDTAGDDDTGDDDTGDDDTGDDDSGDDDTAANTGMFGYLGDATASDAGYDGWEELYLIAEKGLGDDVCRVRYDVDATAPRDDCADCMWAHDVVVSNPQVTLDVDGACAAIGYDAAAIAALDGTTKSYGYAEEYFGHADVIMVMVKGEWSAVSFATWDDGSENFLYDWEVGFEGY
jgi:hypothetical protein